MTTNILEKPAYRSVSQLNTYNQCGYRYYLERIAKVWQRPAAWLAQGSAVHEALELFERSGRGMTLDEAQTSFSEAYSRYIGESTEITPNFEYWFASGRYRGEEDTERRHGEGIKQVKRYFDWIETDTNYTPWRTPDGEYAIELKFDIELGGNVDDRCAEGEHVADCECRDGIPVTGFIDLVVVGQDGDLIVRDHKTGNKPGDDFQLAVYSLAIAETYGIERPRYGDYWMGKSGKATYPFDLSDWTVERITERFRELDDGVKSERFDPDPEPQKCSFCSVRTSCSFAL